ncbi:MAG: membrane bound O-acyl transferase family-domain-containing protein [Planctomycetaceae bacterium]|nr:membrane bound O-acyl transferase family-domain-containing protein [Planctomycetaceae bacterium]
MTTTRTIAQNTREEPAAWQVWLPQVVLPAAVLLLTPAYWPRWAVMWLLVVAIYAGWKWVSWLASGRREPPDRVPSQSTTLRHRGAYAPRSPASPWKHIAYLVLWPGLDSAAFLGDRKPPQPKLAEWLLAAAKLGLGAALLWVIGPRTAPQQELLLGWIGMIGMVLVAHFGSVHMLSCFWRSVGIDAKPLMDWPIAATSVSDFWGRRWNTAFRDLAHQFVFRPLVRRWGGAWAIAASFVFSGLVHDLVISVPAQAGYGWPTLYFLLQGAAVFFERSRLGKALGIGSGWRGWLFAAIVILGPACWLFHPPFVEAVIVPFMRVIGAAPPV